MARARKPALDKRGRLQKVLDAERGQVIEIADKGKVTALYQDIAPLVNEHAMQRGDYEPLGEYGEARRTLINRKSSPIAAWFKEGGPGFEDPQARAIEYIERLWGSADTQGRLVANYGYVSRGGYEGRNHFEAITELGEWQREFGADYWGVFENCVRFDEPAGTAGSKLASNRPQSASAAKAIVGFIASMIAARKRL